MLDLIKSYDKSDFTSYGATKLITTLIDSGYSDNLPKINVSLMGTVTLDFLVDALQAEGLVNKINIKPYCLPAEQVDQLSLNPDSALYDSSPDVICIMMRIEDISPKLINPAIKKDSLFFEAIENEILERLEQIFSAIQSNCHSVIVMHTFEAPSWDSDITNEAANPDSLWSVTQKVNLSLMSLVDKYKGIYLVNIDRIIRQTSIENWRDNRLWYHGRIAFGVKNPRNLIRSWMPIFKQNLGMRKKCLILDLDNTLWGGVVGEDGIDGVKIGQDFPGSIYTEVQSQILGLWHAGVMLAISSKNNLDDVKSVFEERPEMILKWDHFLVKKVNWIDKATNIKEIANELNIGLEHTVFLDDNVVECDLVSKMLPDVTVLTVPLGEIHNYPNLLIRERLFDGSKITPEDRGRNTMYSANIERSRLEKKSTDLSQFLSSLLMSSNVEQIKSNSIHRAHQMISKTNQFNLTTKRYSEVEIEAMCASKNWLCLIFDLKDKFGDNGKVGLVLINFSGKEAAIDSFLMSCRVIGRTLENGILEYVANFLKNKGVLSLHAEYRPTKKNSLVSELYENNNFSLVKAKDGGEKKYRLDLAKELDFRKHYVTINKKDVL